MAKYHELEDRKVTKFGTSLAITLPASFVRKNGIKKGNLVEVKSDGGKNLLIVAKKE